MKKRILAFVQLPPPVYGQSLMNKYFIDSKLLNDNFKIRYIGLHYAPAKNKNKSGLIKKRTFFLNYYFVLFWNLLIFRPHLVYFTISVTGKAFLRDVIFVKLIKLFRKKIVYHFHNKGIIHYSGKTHLDKLYKLVFKNSYAIHLSSLLYYDIEKYVPKEKVFFCTNGIPVIDMAQFPKTLKNERPHVLFLSNLIASKGVWILLEACTLIKKKKIDFVCDIIGDWGDITPKEFNNYINVSELGDSIKYLGPLVGEERLQYYSNADIFVFPTFYPNECFPLVILEAMHFGLPVISTYEGAIPEIVDNNKTGFLIRQGSAEELAKQIEILISNPELREEMGNCAGNKFLEKYTLGNFENRMKEILCEILEKSKPAQKTEIV